MRPVQNDVKKLIVILGPTAAGKSEMAVKIAKKFNGEVISADSRQVYRGMDIGTGKVSRDRNWKLESNPSGSPLCVQGNWKLYSHSGILHYLLDVASPKRRFTVVQYRKLALEAIKKILKNVHVPILCGGTGFYIQAVVDGIIIPEVPPDWRLRLNLNKFQTEVLFNKLKKLDPRRAKIIDKNNRRRLIRALEIVIKTKKPVPILKKNPLPYPVLMIGIKKEPEVLKKIIEKRLLKRFRQGMIKEVKKLHKSGISWKRLEEFGLEYKWIARYLQKKVNYEEMVEKLKKDIEHFAKRQMTWFKRDKRIKWVKNYQEAEKLIKKFL